MTFIASVVARKGVALIADSLVTTTRYVMEVDEFIKHAQSKKKDDGTIELEHDELIQLFHSKPSHTKNFEEKLFKYDDFTGITTAGSALINDKRIGELIEELIALNRKNKRSYNGKKLESKVKDFCNFFSKKVKQHVKKYQRISGTYFIYTHYDKTVGKIHIYKIQIRDAVRKDLDDPEFKIVEATVQPDQYKVVCDGQNRISERILFGDIETFYDLIPKIVDNVMKDYQLQIVGKPAEYYMKVLKTLQENGGLGGLYEDMTMFQISQLSLQQAVDLACLLMRLEMDIQQYTKNIPTVGGLIKLATIDSNGFKFVSGHHITKPSYIR